jgi:hypothetical protein
MSIKICEYKIDALENVCENYLYEEFALQIIEYDDVGSVR